MCKEDGVGGKKEASLVHKMVQGSQVFHGRRLAATEACPYQKEKKRKRKQRKTVIALVLKGMNARRLGLHIISSIIK